MLRAERKTDHKALLESLTTAEVTAIAGTFRDVLDDWKNARASVQASMLSMGEFPVTCYSPEGSPRSVKRIFRNDRVTVVGFKTGHVSGKPSLRVDMSVIKEGQDLRFTLAAAALISDNKFGSRFVEMLDLLSNGNFEHLVNSFRHGPEMDENGNVVPAKWEDTASAGWGTY